MVNKLAPSILSADFKELGTELKKIEEAGAAYVHIDVMDGAFVPSISFGMPVIASIRSATDLVFDVHLMVENPERYIQVFAECGADLITVHAEACRHLDRVIAQIKETGKKVGVALNPATPLSVLDYILEKVDMVLVMTVNPGFGGQSYIKSCTEKIRSLRKLADIKNPDLDIQVDGGINHETIRTVLEAGANVIVAGSTVFNGDAAQNTRQLLGVMKEYEE